MARGALAPAVAAALVLGACGYAFTHRYVAKGGAERVHVRAFENLSTDPELGAAMTGALRAALSRRGAGAGEGTATTIEGEVRASEPVPSSAWLDSGTSQIGTWSVALEVRARLVTGGAKVAEHVWRRDATYLAGTNGDPLETEGRRALALRRLAEEAAPEILRVFER